MTDSIHSARWAEQIDPERFEVRVFPSDSPNHHSRLSNFRIYRVEPKMYNRIIRLLYKSILRRIDPHRRVRKLLAAIRRYRPDIIHTLETQKAGYFYNEVYPRISQHPFWIHTNWGSDLHLFGRFDEHIGTIKSVLTRCDLYLSECQRDNRLAQKFGYAGALVEPFPNTGGFHLDVCRANWKGTPSNRKAIMVKGYQGWAGRCLVAIRALERCADLIKEYTIFIYSHQNKEEVIISGRLLEQNTGCKVVFVPDGTDHEEILKLHGASRISIGLSITDAISTSFLEALVMGSFPIQSWTSAADEYAKDGVGGRFVHPEDSDHVEAAIRLALTDDELVDRAAEINKMTADERLDYGMINGKIRCIYDNVWRILVLEHQEVGYVRQ